MVNKEKRRCPGQSRLRANQARRALLRWHKQYGRHGLPWRGNHDPYAVLVSEMMLQQTTVATVAPRFAAWMMRFPSLTDLAVATEQEVLAAWEGLGYYNRARRLHAAAQAIVKDHDGVVPKDEEALLALPGVGAYTAAAVRAFAYNLSAVVLDTNIIRVLARWDNLTDAIDTSAGIKTVQQTAVTLFSSTGCRTIASALMDLGASLCGVGIPGCRECPLNRTCRAQNPQSLPRKKPRAGIISRTEHRSWHQKENRVFLKLSCGPLWNGLWILPEWEGIPLKGRPVAKITYPVTKYRVTMKVHRVYGIPQEGLRGFTEAELKSIPIPSPHRRAIAATGFSRHSVGNGTSNPGTHKPAR